MFRKASDASLSGRVAVKGKVAREVFESAARQWGSGSAAVESLVDKKASVQQQRLPSKASVYGEQCVDGGVEPLVLDLCTHPKGPGDFVPTVYALWRAPSLLPTVVVHAPVSEFVLNGADVMGPGVVSSDARHLPRVAKGARVAVRALGNPLPFAVGEMLSSGEDSATVGRRGRLVRVLHSYRDELWAVGSRLAPRGFQQARVLAVEAEDAGRGAEEVAEGAAGGGGAHGGGGGGGGGEAEGEVGGAEGEVGGAEGEVGEAARNEDEAEDEETEDGRGGAGLPVREYADPATNMDGYVVDVLMQGLRTRATKSDFPMLASLFVTSVLLPSRRRAADVEWKTTKWRRAGAFLADMASQGLLSLTTEDDDEAERDGASGSVLWVTSARFAHPLLQSFVPWPLEETAGGAGDRASAAAGGIGVRELFQVKERAVPLVVLGLLARAWLETQGRASGDLSGVVMLQEGLASSRKLEAVALPPDTAGREGCALVADLGRREITALLLDAAAWRVLCESYVTANVERLVLAADRSQLSPDPVLALATQSAQDDAAVAAFLSALPTLPFLSDVPPTLPLLASCASVLSATATHTASAAAAAPEPIRRGKWVQAAEGRCLQRFHMIRLATGDVVVRRGSPSTIRIVRGTNAKGKAATVVLGLATLDVDLTRVARTLAKACACSASVVPLATSNARAILTSSPDPDAVVRKLEELVGIPASLTRIERIKRIAAIGILPQSEHSK